MPGSCHFLLLLDGFRDSTFQDLNIGEDQLQVDGFNITKRINASVYMDDIAGPQNNVLHEQWHLLHGYLQETGCQDPLLWMRPLQDLRYQRIRSTAGVIFLGMIQISQAISDLVIRYRYQHQRLDRWYRMGSLLTLLLPLSVN